MIVIESEMKNLPLTVPILLRAKVWLLLQIGSEAGGLPTSEQEQPIGRGTYQGLRTPSNTNPLEEEGCGTPIKDAVRKVLLEEEPNRKGNHQGFFL